MEVWSDESNYIDFHFEPHGTTFNQPVEIQLSWATMKDISVDDLILYYYNEKRGKWLEEKTAVFDAEAKTATLYVDHFSYYYYGRR
jgi:hypothetical protein